jgi:hypothetical protein
MCLPPASVDALECLCQMCELVNELEAAGKLGGAGSPPITSIAVLDQVVNKSITVNAHVPSYRIPQHLIHGRSRSGFRDQPTKHKGIGQPRTEPETQPMQAIIYPAGPFTKRVQVTVPPNSLRQLQTDIFEKLVGQESDPRRFIICCLHDTHAVAQVFAH